MAPPTPPPSSPIEEAPRIPTRTAMTTNLMCRTPLTAFACGHSHMHPPACSALHIHTDPTTVVGTRSCDSCVDCQILSLMLRIEERKRQLADEAEASEDGWEGVDSVEGQATELERSLVLAKLERESLAEDGVEIGITLTVQEAARVTWDRKGR